MFNQTFLPWFRSMLPGWTSSSSRVESSAKSRAVWWAQAKSWRTSGQTGLKAAGAKELYLVFSVSDMPGPPFVVVPVNDGAQAEGIARTIHADPKPIFGAIVAGKPETLARISREPASARPELSDAFGASGGDTVAIRLFVLPSADSRRVLEELVPRFPAELGGGPITDLTGGLLWAVAGVQNAEKPAIKIVAAGRNAEAAKSLIRLAENVVAFLRRSPEVQKSIPGLSGCCPSSSPRWRKIA